MKPEGRQKGTKKKVLLKKFLKNVISQEMPDFNKKQKGALLSLILSRSGRKGNADFLLENFLMRFPLENKERVTNAIYNVHFHIMKMKYHSNDVGYIQITYDMLFDSVDDDGVLTSNDTQLLPFSDRRKHIKNPAPHYHFFVPKWIDRHTEITFSLAQDTDVDLVKLNAKIEPDAIIFVAKLGKDKEWPYTNQRLIFTDFEDWTESGFGTIQETRFSRKRSMGIVIIKPLYWKISRHLYL